MGIIQDWLAARRGQIEQDLQTIEQRRWFSPIFWGMATVTVPLIKKHLRGRVIDLGCGSMPFRTAIEAVAEAYHGFDYFPRPEFLDADVVRIIGDVQQMAMIGTASYDGAFCNEVLEHVPDPFRAVAEMARILKPSGVLVLSVPHLSRLHDLPHDYYRYTEYGLQYMLTQSGFDVVELQTRGGLFTFLGHQVSTIIVGAFWGIPLLQQLIWAVNRVVTVSCYQADQLTGTARLFPLGYVAVARKIPTPAAGASK